MLVDRDSDVISLLDRGSDADRNAEAVNFHVTFKTSTSAPIFPLPHQHVEGMFRESPGQHFVISVIDWIIDINLGMGDEALPFSSCAKEIVINRSRARNNPV